ncbi:MAG: amino acid kinase [Euryarchaeota archaeon]|nr:amino acid kinase [Euryarchaeota archaeon]
MRAVLKVGGSLISVALDLVRTLVEANVDCLIVPGGGPFADAVRLYRNVLNDTTAHWMAILAMNQYGWFLSAAGARITTTIDVDISGVSVLLPFDEVFANDPLPHSWDVTSDSIAAWIAHRLSADLVVATNVDGIFIDGHFLAAMNARAIIGQTCIDAFCPSLLELYGMKCVVVNGSYYDRLLDALNGVPTIGTTIHGRE